MRVRVVELPAGEDPDSFLQQHTGEDFLRYVDEATTFLDYQLTRAQRFYDLHTPAGQADCVARILPLLRKIDNRVEQWGYVTRLAEKIGVPVAVLQQEMATRAPAKTGEEQPVMPHSMLPARSRARVEYDLLHLLLHDVSLCSQAQPHLTLDDFQEPVLRELYTLLLQVAPQSKQSLFPGIHERAENDAQRQLLARIAAESLVAEGSERQRALQDYIHRLQQRRWQRQRGVLKERLREAERHGDTVLQQRLLQEYMALSKTQGMRNIHSRG
jgi:DNA primase